MKSRVATASDDPVTAYAQAVLDGHIPMGPSVRASCKRHLQDLKTAKRRGYVWDLQAAIDAVEFFPLVLMIDVGKAPAPFELMWFQQFIVGSLYGWKHAKTGSRRFKKGYVEIGKGSGKTPLSAGVGLKALCADGELAPEVYAAGAKRDQSMLIFEDCVKMVDRSPRLSRAVRKLGNNVVYELRHPRSGGKFKPLGMGKKKSGQRVHCALVDELHEHQDRYTVDMLEDGFKGREQPLMLVTTNAGFDRNSICWEWHEKAVQVAEGTIDDDEFFSYVCDLDPDDDPLEDEACWLKTNPGLGVTIQHQYLRTQVKNARQIPGRENGIRRLNFCEWTDADVGWMTRQAWEAIEEEGLGTYSEGAFVAPDFAAVPGYAGAECYLGLDLSYGLDLSALAFAFPEDGRLVTWIEYFMPIEISAEREKQDRKPYPLWIKEGRIHGVPGKVIKVEYIARRLAQVMATYDVRWCAYDRYRHKELDRDVDALNVIVPWIEHPQGFRRGGKLKGIIGEDGKEVDNPLWMPGSCTALEQRMLDSSITTHPSKIVRGQVSAVAVRDDPAGTGNHIFDKRRANGRIDGVVALAMAVGAADMRLPIRNIKGMLARPVMVT